MPRSRTYEYVKTIFEKEGYELLSSEYVNNREKLKYKCPNGHENKMSYHAFSCGNRCPSCYKESNRISYEEVYAFIDSLEYTWLNGMPDESYVSRSRIRYSCKNGHVSEVSLGNLQQGYRCRVCAHSKERHGLEDVRKAFSDRGYTLLSDTYENNHTLLKYMCKEGHIAEIRYKLFIQGYGCMQCSIETRRTDYTFIKDFFESRDYTLLSSEYIPNQKLRCICPEGHEWEVYWSEFYSAGTRCKSCFCRVSKAERNIASFIEKLGFEVSCNRRDLINPYELDIYIPSKKVAFEYCGLFWHSQESGGKDKYYHINKLSRCKENGIKLYTIFEDEYINRPDVVKSRIKAILGCVDNKIYARNCVVKAINSSVGREFLNKYHLQGSGRAKYYFGLFYKNDLVMVLSFGAPARAHARGQGRIELKRMCSISDVLIVGGASKVFKFSIKKMKEERYKEVVSYCDMRWARDNTIYEKIGFVLKKKTGKVPTPHYIVDNYTKRIRNQSLALKENERNLNKTEHQIRIEQGYDIIWDCGHRTYIYMI